MLPGVRNGKLQGIWAKAHSDDHEVEIEFDAAPWFAQATDKEILGLADTGWGGDYEADAVAQFFSEGATRALFYYLDQEPTMPHTDDRVGFECRVDEEQAMEWLKTYRSPVFEELQDKHGGYE